MGREPGLGGPAQAALFLLGDHLERVAPARAAFRLHLDEGEPPAPADDQVELVAAGPDVPLEDPVAAQAVEPPRPPLSRTTCLNRARVPDVFLAVRRPKGQCFSTALRLKRRQGREGYA
jgi:hypothetical protein